jgi:hypothetical protein
MRLKVFPGRRSWYEPFDSSTEAVERSDPLAGQVAHFAAVIRGEEQPICTGRDGLRTLLVTEAVAEAARTGRPVEVGSCADTPRAGRRSGPPWCADQTDVRARSYSSAGTGVASRLPRSLRWTRNVSRALKQAIAAMTAQPKVKLPTISGTFDSGGATAA